MFTANQIAALKYLILVSRVGTELSKRVMYFLIDQSKGLTEEVCLSLVEDREGYNADEISAAGYGTGAMMSANCGVHLNEVLLAMGSTLHFCIRYGDFDPSRVGDPFNIDGQFAGLPSERVAGTTERPGLVAEGMPLRYTFWLSKTNYSRKARYVSVSREELEKVELTKPELEYWH